MTFEIQYLKSFEEKIIENDHFLFTRSWSYIPLLHFA
jgi:hypothetical protein